jgi:hypothetical protein
MRVKHSDGRFVRLPSRAFMIIMCTLILAPILGGSGDASSLQTNPPVKACEGVYARPNFASVADEHKACLMKNASALREAEGKGMAIVIDGHRDKGETKGISLTRINYLYKFLVDEMLVNAAAVVVRNFGDTCPVKNGNATRNRRFEIWLVPKATDTTIDNPIGSKTNPPAACPDNAMLVNETPAKPADSTQ